MLSNTALISPSCVDESIVGRKIYFNFVYIDRVERQVDNYHNLSVKSQSSKFSKLNYCEQILF